MVRPARHRESGQLLDFSPAIQSGERVAKEVLATV
jgi:hypothetical protein